MRRIIPSPIDGGSFYQRFRQRTPIFVVAAITISGLIIHSLPRRRASSWGSGGGAAPPPQQQQQGGLGGPGVGAEFADSSMAHIGADEVLVTRQHAAQDSAIESAIRVPVSEGSVHLGMGGQDLPYLHCGPTYGTSFKLHGAGRELILLHGAAFTKDTWRESGILDGLCLLGSSEEEQDGGDNGLSVTALDLPVTANGIDLAAAFQALSSAGIIGGNAAFFVSPSASGSTILDLGELAAGFGTNNSEEWRGEDPSKLLNHLVRGWIPVAALSVIKARVEALEAFVQAGIPVLAVYGDKDQMGQKSSNLLVKSANALMLELEGRHPCYLDSPDEFVQNVIQFVNGEWGENVGDEEVGDDGH